MGFYLWFDRGLAWAQGTYEYRPMGTAVIAESDLFRRRDFDPRRSLRAPETAEFAGQFAQRQARLHGIGCADLGQIRGDCMRLDPFFPQLLQG